MSPVSERVSDASPPEWGDRAVRSLALEALALLQAGQSGASSRLDQRDAPSLAMSTRTAEERDSQPAQRDELAHSRTVPIGDGVLPLTIDTSPPATTGTLERVATIAPPMVQGLGGVFYENWWGFL